MKPLELPPRAKDETGERYGRLTVVAFAGALKTHAMWKCRCDCGQITLVSGRKLRTGTTVSCGCARADAEVRRAARLATPKRKRRAIAKLGARARWGETNQKKD